MKRARSLEAGLFLALFFGYFLVSGGQAPKGDAHAPFLGAIQLVQGKGILESKVMPGQMFLIVPLALVTQTVVRALADDSFRWVALILLSNVFPALVTAATAVILLRVARLLGHGERAGLAAALLFALATPAAVYAKSFFPQPTEAFFLVACVWGILAARAALARDAAGVGGRKGGAASGVRDGASPATRPLVLSGLAYGALLLVKAVALAYLPVFAAFLLTLRRDGRGARRLATWGGPALALALFYLPYNAAARGWPFDFGYGQGRDALWGFSTSTLVGLWGLLLSPGKGFFFYAPVLALAIPGVRRLLARDRAAALLLVGLALAPLLLHAHWWAWHGDNAWGPRYLVPVLPIVTLLAVEALRAFRPRRDARTAAFAALVALSVGVQVLGAAFTNDAYQTLTYDAVLPRYRASDGPRGPRDDEIHVHAIPEFSPLAGHAWLLGHALRGDSSTAYLADYPWRALRPDGAWAPRIPDPPPELDFWLARLPRAYATARGVLAVVALLAAAGAVFGAIRLARSVRSAPSA